MNDVNFEKTLQSVRAERVEALLGPSTGSGRTVSTENANGDMA